LSKILSLAASAAALALLAAAAQAQPTAAPAAPPAAKPTEYVTIALEADVNAPADAAWKKVGGYCDIGAWMNTSCEVTSGKDGEVGAVRRIAGRVDEVLVARTPFSYTYAQPKSPIDYHGTFEIRPAGAGKSKILYTLVYDLAGLPPTADKAADQQRRRSMFTNVVNTIKTKAEAK
jgi:opacity protein-like surface antigen